MFKQKKKVNPKWLNLKKCSDNTFFKSISKFFCRKNKNSKDSNFSYLEVVCLMAFSIFFGIIIGSILTYGKGSSYGYSVDETERELLDSYNRILSGYYENISGKDLMNAAVDGMIGVLDDPHSVYMDSEQTDAFKQKVDGSYIGLGVTLASEDNGVYVYQVLKNSPAEKSGIQVNDIFVKINGKDITNLEIDELIEYSKGESGEKVKITVKRDNELIDLEVIRSVVEISSVYNKVFEKDDVKIGYIFIETFAANTYEQFNDILKDMESENIDSLIIDVRDNPGGHLNQAKKILSLFFDKKTVLYQLQTKDKIKKVYSSSNKKRTYDIAVLINSNSASASEILASSFQDNYKNSVLIGVKSYGKGTVQQEVLLSTGASMKYTVEKWLTAKGKTIEGSGIVPDKEIEQNPLYYLQPSDENDVQLQKAFEVLTKKEF